MIINEIVPHETHTLEDYKAAEKLLWLRGKVVNFRNNCSVIA